MISLRTKAALPTAKTRGVTLGRHGKTVLATGPTIFVVTRPRFTIPIHCRRGGVISRVVSQIWGALACERLKYLRLLNQREGSLSERLFLLPVIEPLNLAEKYASHIA